MASGLEGKKIAIVGGAGFIGHNMALTLKRLGAHVEVVDSLQINNLAHFASGTNEIPNRKLYMHLINQRLQLLSGAEVPLHIQDARDYHGMSRVLNEIKPETIVHLAAIAHANRANKSPYTTFDHSLRTLENSLDIARDFRSHFIYFSSSMVYGNFDGEAATEDRPCDPMGIYGTLKYCGEKMITAYNQVFDLPYTIIRPSALYGERCVSRRVGQAFIENAIRGIELTINGDGNDRLDFTYIDDLIQGVTKAITNSNARNQIFNLTYGNGRSINEMAAIVREKFPEIRIHHDRRDRLMPERGTLSIEKARTMLGYEPQYPLEVGFVRYIEWYADMATHNAKLFT